MIEPLSKVDWCLLRAQRNHLLTIPDHKHITGLTHFLDSLLDHAVDTSKLIPLVAPDMLEMSQLYKYVDVGGEFRFFDFIYDHVQAVGKDEREDLRSAGKIGINPNEIILIELGSMSLKIPGDWGDVELLEDLLGKPVSRRTTVRAWEEK